jgi:ribonuclease P protein component
LLPRTHRLSSSSDFRRATRDGARAGSRTLVVHLVVGDVPGPPRIGFVVSKAVGNSVVRNRVQRRLRHLAREHLTSLPGSAVLVIRALPASAEASYAELADDLGRCLGRVSA